LKIYEVKQKRYHKNFISQRVQEASKAGFNAVTPGQITIQNIGKSDQCCQDITDEKQIPSFLIYKIKRERHQKYAKAGYFVRQIHKSSTIWFDYSVVFEYNSSTNYDLRHMAHSIMQFFEGTLERRRRYLIDRDIQISFVKFVLALLVVVSIFFSFLMLHINRYMTDYIMVTVEEIAKNPGKEMSSIHLGDLKKEFVKKDIIFVLEVCFVVLLLGAIIGLLTIRFTHRLAGPVYRMHSALDKALHGDFSPRIMLRKKDLLKDLVNKLNHLIESMDKRSRR